MVETEYVRQRAVGLGQPAHGAQDRRPAGAGPAMRGRHRQPQQAALADQFALAGGMSAQAVALDGGGGQRLRQRFQRLGRRGRRRVGRASGSGARAVVAARVLHGLGLGHHHFLDGRLRPAGKGFQRSRRRSSARPARPRPAQQRVEQDAQQHHVGLQELARVHGHVADAGLRRDGLGHDQHHPPGPARSAGPPAWTAARRAGSRRGTGASRSGHRTGPSRSAPDPPSGCRGTC